MKFQFNVHINDQDYVDCNVFYQTKSPYGKKQFRTLMILWNVAMVLLYIMNFFTIGFRGSIPALLISSLSILFFKKIHVWFLKGHLKSLRKHGKPGYSPEGVITFSEENFVEVTPENKTEYTYSAIERISVINDKAIYLHLNSLSVIILPFSCFESPSQREEFMEFIKIKCATVDFY